jgi:hypothetical protein
MVSTKQRVRLFSAIVSKCTSLFIVGLQKSGTTLLARLLVETGCVSKPFRGEGDDFWGNTPPFSPTGFPAGAAYEKSGGERGHAMDATDVTPDVVRIMRERFEALITGGTPEPSIILNKSPYNTVRLPWLRAVFPESVIVAMVRTPAANVFSLCKKFHPHEQGGLPPEEGWWGVKPPGWRRLRGEDVVAQCARQWAAVNEILQRDRAHADLVVSYRALCEDPGRYLAEILARAGGALDRAPAPVTCFDEEFARGSRLRSKNRYYRELKSLATPAPGAETIEIEPLDKADIATIESICGDVALRFPELRQ